MRASSSRPVAIVLSLGVAAACVLGRPAPATAQQNPPLADVARKEAERRKGVKETQKVITTKDLPESARKPRSTDAPPAEGGGAAPAGAGSGGSGGDQKPAGQGADSQKDEKYWRGRMTQAQDTLRRNEAFAAALQSQINGLTTDFVNRDDPYQREKIGEQRQRALGELERVKADIELSKKQMADIEEEARKAGVPPGWLR